MVGIRSWQRSQWNTADGWWPSPSNSNAVLVATEFPQAVINQSTVMRHITWPTITCKVNANLAGTPPWGWWHDMALTWQVWVKTVFPGPVNPGLAETTDRRVILAGRLRPHIDVTPPTYSTPDVYWVAFTGPREGLHSKGRRATTTGSTGTGIYSGVSYAPRIQDATHDYLNFSDFDQVTVSCTVVQETLWEGTPV
jgi:hypothetical protein